MAVWYLQWENWLAIFEVLVGLGFVIFVHELGHFAVARLCGVKCEKFYLGYDIAGLKLWKFRRGETEYGIGILPLGGYVKMLGQEDNPAHLREEIERAKQPAQTDPAKSAPSAAEVEAARQALYNPRSYLAQSVPRRMAIISAGVVMNLIFAFIMAVVAIGCFSVQEHACEIGQIMPGDGAWQADLKAGDEILEVGGQPVATFQDMLEAVALGDVEKGIPMVVRRPGREAPLHIEVKATQAEGKPRIGVFSSSTLTLSKEKEGVTAAGTPAAEADPPLLPGDKIVKIDDQPVHNYAELRACLAARRDQPLSATVQRTLPPVKGAPPAAAKTEEVVVRIAPNPMRTLGPIMEMGPITAIQAGSPAAAAGIRPGDVIRAVDGLPVADPMTLPELLRGRRGQTVTLEIERAGDESKPPLAVPVTLSHRDNFDPPQLDGNPLAIPSLGIAYQVLNRVRVVLPGSPAAATGLRPGDVITAATILPPDAKTMEQLREKFHKPELSQDKAELTFDNDYKDWPCLIYVLQKALPGSTVELKWQRGRRPSRPRSRRSWTRVGSIRTAASSCSRSGSCRGPAVSAKPSAGEPRRRSIPRCWCSACCGRCAPARSRPACWAARYRSSRSP